MKRWDVWDVWGSVWDVLDVFLSRHGDRDSIQAPCCFDCNNIYLPYDYCSQNKDV